MKYRPLNAFIDPLVLGLLAQRNGHQPVLDYWPPDGPIERSSSTARATAAR